MAESVGSIFVKVGAETGSFDRAMAGVQGRMSSVGDRLATVGRAMTVGVTLPIVAGAALAVKAFANFEQALNSFQAVTGATGKQMSEVSDLAKKLGNDIKLPGTSAKDAAEAMTELAKGGMDVDQSMKAARATLQLAAAAEIENAEAATIVADALNAFHLKAKDATKVTDLLAAAANASTGGITDMSDSLKMVSAVAASAGIPIDDMVTAIAEMANAGIKGSDAGTSLKTMLLSLQAPTEKAKNLMKDLGINVYDAQGQMLPMRDLIQEFTGALGGLTQEQRNAALATIFGSDAVRAANVVLLGGVQAWDTLHEAVGRGGAAAELAASKMKGTAGAIEGMKSSLETAAITVGESLAPHVQSAARLIGELATAFTKLPASAQSFVVMGGIAAAALGPILALVGNVKRAITGLGLAFKTLAIPLAVFGIEELMSDLLGLNQATTQSASVFQRFGQAVRDAKSALDAMTNAQNAAAQAGMNVKFAQTEVQAAVQAKTAALREAAGADGELSASEQRHFQQSVEGQQIINRVASAYLNLKAARDAVKQATEAATQAESNHAQAMQRAMNAIGEELALMSSYAERTGHTALAVQLLAGNIGTMLTKAVQQGNAEMKSAALAAIYLAESTGKVPTQIQVQAFAKTDEAQRLVQMFNAELKKIPPGQRTELAVNDLATAVLAAYRAGLEKLPKNWKTVIDKPGGIDAAIAEFKKMADKAKQATDDAKEAVRAGAPGLRTAGQAAGQAATNGLWKAAQKMAGKMREASGDAVNAGESKVGAFRGIGSSMGVGLVSGFEAAVAGLAAAAAAAINNAEAAAHAAIDNPPTPSRVFMEIGESMSYGMVAGFLLHDQELSDKVSGSVQKALDAAKAKVDAQKTKLSDAFGNLMSDALSAFDKVTAAWQPAAAIELQAAQEQRALEQRNNALAGAQQRLNEALAGGDPTAILAAQQAVADAEFEIWRVAKENEAAQAQAKHDEQRELRRRHFEEQLTQLQTALEKHPEQHDKIQKKINKLLNRYLPDYVKSGRNIGLALAEGITDAKVAIERAAEEIAQILAKYLKTSSPTELGPMSDLDHWWDGLAPALLKGLDEDKVRSAMDAMINGIPHHVNFSKLLTQLAATGKFDLGAPVQAPAGATAGTNVAAPTYITIQADMVVGSGAMDELARKVTAAQQRHGRRNPTIMSGNGIRS